MKLLKDITTYCIKVDCFMWSEEKGEYTEPAYLSIDTETKTKDGVCMNLITFKENITPCLRIFDTKKEATEYMKKHLSNSFGHENERVVKLKLKYNLNEDMYMFEEV